MINGIVVDKMCKMHCFFSDVAMLKNVHFCIATNSHLVTGKYDDEMENIVCVRPFQLHSFHIRGGGGTKNTHLKWSPYGAKQETEPQMASPISFSLGVLRGRLAAPPWACEQINTRNQAITLLWKRYVHNRYVIIFHLLAVFNTLIIISPPWTGRKLFPPQPESFFFLGKCFFK